MKWLISDGDASFIWPCGATKSLSLLQPDRLANIKMLCCVCVNVCVFVYMCELVCVLEPLIGLNFNRQQKIRLENSSSGLYRLCFVVPLLLFALF